MLLFCRHSLQLSWLAALTAALSSALGRMVVEYSRGKKSAAGHEAAHAEILSALAELQATALALHALLVALALAGHYDHVAAMRQAIQQRHCHLL